MFSRSIDACLVALLAGLFAGCDPQDPGAGGNDAGSGTATEVAPIPDPAAFETIPLANDSSYESQAVPEGTTPGEVREFTALKLKYCWCPPGTGPIGTPDDEIGHLLVEVLHDVTLSKGFWLQQTEVTQSQYESLMGVNPSNFKGPDNPVDSVTWTEAAEFCRRLSELPPEKRHGNVFRLPTEAEWEYACRAGTRTPFSWGDSEEQMTEFGWFNRNSDRTTHPVGQKKPNPWNLFDIHGNVCEWCSDYFGDFTRDAVTDPRGPESGNKRVLRGGNWFYPQMHSRSSHREAYAESVRYVGLGFRTAITPAGRSE